MAEENRTGYLEVLVLDELEVASRTGYELMSLLEKKMGSRPSPGSMYPLLNKMLSGKLISVSIDGRKKNYSITSLGKKLLKEKMREKESMISRHMDLFKSMISNHFCIRHPMMNIINREKVSRKISPETAKLLLDLKEKMLDILLSENYSKNEKELNAELKKILKILEQINKVSVKKQNKKQFNPKNKLVSTR